MSADLIEIHVVFEKPKSEAHMEKVAAAIVRAVNDNLLAHFPKQRPHAYVADVRGEDDE